MQSCIPPQSSGISRLLKRVSNRAGPILWSHCCVCDDDGTGGVRPSPRLSNQSQQLVLRNLLEYLDGVVRGVIDSVMFEGQMHLVGLLLRGISYGHLKHFLGLPLVTKGPSLPPSFWDYIMKKGVFSTKHINKVCRCCS